METATIAIIVIIIMIIICIIALLIFFCMWCRLKIVDDTNIRKRVLVRSDQGYAQQEIKTQVVQQPVVVPAPMPLPVPVPLPRREIIQEVIPPPRPQTPQPDIVVHEVVHRYEPPALPPPAPVIIQPPQPQVIRRNSWSEGHHCHHHRNDDEWIMIKKKKKQRRVVDDSSSDDDDDYPRYRNRVNIVSPRLNAYDLAVPAVPMMQPMVQPMAIQPMAVQPISTGAGMGAATYVVGNPVAGAVVASGSSFQPTYGVLPRM